MSEQYLPKFDTRSVFQNEKTCAQEDFSEADTLGDCVPYVLNDFKAA